MLTKTEMPCVSSLLWLAEWSFGEWLWKIKVGTNIVVVPTQSAIGSCKLSFKQRNCQNLLKSLLDLFEKNEIVFLVLNLDFSDQGLLVQPDFHETVKNFDLIANCPCSRRTSFLPQPQPSLMFQVSKNASEGQEAANLLAARKALACMAKVFLLLSCFQHNV